MGKNIETMKRYKNKMFNVFKKFYNNYLNYTAS